MSSTREWDDWLRDFPRKPRDRYRMAEAALEAYAACRRKKNPSASEVEPILRAACAPQVILFEPACQFLFDLARTRPAAQDAVLQMANHSSATTRRNAVGSLIPDHPESLCVAIVEKALGDRSAIVREMAVDRVGMFRFLQFLPRLEEMQRTETDKALLHSLNTYIRILREGFCLKRSRDGGYYLTLMGMSSVSHWLGGPYISREESSPRFTREEVQRLEGESGELYLPEGQSTEDLIRGIVARIRELEGRRRPARKAKARPVARRPPKRQRGGR